MSIAAVTSDGSRVAATVRTPHDRTDLGRQRRGDSTFISALSTRMKAIDTRNAHHCMRDGVRPTVRFEGFTGEARLNAVPNAINKIIERGLVDPDQVGVHGQSYGGYATNRPITQTDRFAAAANVSGKVNIISFLADSPKITARNYAAAEVGPDRIGATPWEHPHRFIEHSAVMFADRIETPLPRLSGEGDWNVPATNQREMCYALRRLEEELV